MLAEGPHLLGQVIPAPASRIHLRQLSFQGIVFLRKTLSSHWRCLFTLWRVLECFHWWSSTTSSSHTGSLTLGHTRVSRGCVYKVHTVSLLARRPECVGCQVCVTEQWTQESSWYWRGQQLGLTPRVHPLGSCFCSAHFLATHFGRSTFSMIDLNENTQYNLGKWLQGVPYCLLPKHYQRIVSFLERTFGL